MSSAEYAVHGDRPDVREANAEAAAETMRNAGYDVSTTTIDVSSRASVHSLVETATAHGAGVVIASQSGHRLCAHESGLGVQHVRGDGRGDAEGEDQAARADQRLVVGASLRRRTLEVASNSATATPANATLPTRAIVSSGTVSWTNTKPPHA